MESKRRVTLLIRLFPFLAVAFLESMGLPKPMLSVTRKQVEQGKIDFANSLEYQMYSRHDGPTED